MPLAANTAAAAIACVCAMTAVGTQLAELQGSDSVVDDTFGLSVAISGTTAIVGAGGHANNAGRAYLFQA